MTYYAEIWGKDKYGEEDWIRLPKAYKSIGPAQAAVQRALHHTSENPIGWYACDPYQGDLSMKVCLLARRGGNPIGRIWF